MRQDFFRREKIRERELTNQKGWGMIMNNHSKGNERDSRNVWMRREGAAGVSSREGPTLNLTREQSF